MKPETIQKWSPKRQWAWIRKVIADDAEIRGVMYADGKTCAVGGIALALGAKPNSHGYGFQSGVFNLVRKIPVLNGGNGLGRIIDIIDTNDRYKDRSKRKVALRKLLDRLEKEESGAVES